MPIPVLTITHPLGLLEIFHTLSLLSTWLDVKSVEVEETHDDRTLTP